MAALGRGSRLLRAAQALSSAPGRGMAAGAHEAGGGNGEGTGAAGRGPRAGGRCPWEGSRCPRGRA